MADDKLQRLVPERPSAQSQMIERLCNVILENSEATRKRIAMEERLARAVEALKPDIFNAEQRRETDARENGSRWERVIERLAKLGKDLDDQGDSIDDLRKDTAAMRKVDEKAWLAAMRRFFEWASNLQARSMFFVLALVAMILLAGVAAVALHLKGL